MGEGCPPLWLDGVGYHTFAFRGVLSWGNAESPGYSEYMGIHYNPGFAKAGTDYQIGRLPANPR